MEHRHFPRKSVDVDVQLVTNDGKSYQAHIIEFSAIGMRVIVKDKLPKRVKLVEVQLPGINSSAKIASSMRMFVVHKQGRVLGLCLINENTKINLDRNGMFATNFQKYTY